MFNDACMIVTVTMFVVYVYMLLLLLFTGVDFRNVYSEVDGKLVSMRIWDTAGQERSVKCVCVCV